MTGPNTINVWMLWILQRPPAVKMPEQAVEDDRRLVVEARDGADAAGHMTIAEAALPLPDLLPVSNGDPSPGLRRTRWQGRPAQSEFFYGVLGGERLAGS
jgi:hypothetical protein